MPVSNNNNNNNNTERARHAHSERATQAPAPAHSTPEVKKPLEVAAATVPAPAVDEGVKRDSRAMRAAQDGQMGAGFQDLVYRPGSDPVHGTGIGYKPTAPVSKPPPPPQRPTRNNVA